MLPTQIPPPKKMASDISACTIIYILPNRGSSDGTPVDTSSCALWNEGLVPCG